MKRAALILLFFPLSLLAQNKKQSKSGWNTISSVGLVTGESNNKPVFQFSGGLVFGRYYSGIGIGYDMYQFNSFPLFADLHMGFGKKNATFLYASGGYNFPGKNEDEFEFSKTRDKLKGGFFMDAGMGYRIPVAGLHRLSLSAGYSRKNIMRQKVFNYPCFTGNCSENIHDYKYSLGRIVAKLSWELGRWY